MQIEPGQWVLVDHPMMYDAYVVRRVVSVSKTKFVGERLRSDRDGPFTDYSLAYVDEEVVARLARRGVWE